MTETTGGSKRAARHATWMRNSAMFYLGQRAASEAHFRQVMLRKAARRIGEELDEAEIACLLDETVAYCRANGFLNDDDYAEARSAAGARRGLSRRRVGMMLDAKGIDREQIGRALEDFDDLAAAVRLTKKRRIGAWRRDDGQPGEVDTQREIAILARAGFPFEIAGKAVRMSLEEAEEVLFGPAEG
ncbi:hypothetical protein GCM10007301_08210 [Azorhizobium oxalatiphilum]|uniref:Regulatory protein RecX n=1 Tax=Azorhizobium oxalatiphilum TaxID=980631 RepID=A0A917BNW8_9HYPH|nr:RecX family transcriptional regulator [Azorhizobium oxalatiphilum]GGF51151.1 hypothetical protein GCM10007301_08210 [Azorhizobium oxalatiphilum]